MITLALPWRTRSESNVREHWAARARRTKEFREGTYLMLTRQRDWIDPPWGVTLVRLAPRPLDDDNLRGALKAVRDGVADFLRINDRDPRVSWIYSQQSAGQAYAVYVLIERVKNMERP